MRRRPATQLNDIACSFRLLIRLSRADDNAFLATADPKALQAAADKLAAAIKGKELANRCAQDLVGLDTAVRGGMSRVKRSRTLPFTAALGYS